MIMTRPSRRAGGFALPVRALLCTSTCAVLGLPLLAACTNNAPAEKPGAGGAPNPRALTVQATDTECKAFRHERPVGNSHLRGDERRQQGERVLPLRPGRHCASSAKWKISARALRGSWC